MTTKIKQIKTDPLSEQKIQIHIAGDGPFDIQGGHMKSHLHLIYHCSYLAMKF